ncbi:MAG: hypothetical protein V4668_00860 [Patescibacteria group bacterium]
MSYLTEEEPILDTSPTEASATNSDPRNFSRTLSTFPEWYIVYSAQEYSDLMSRGGRPSQFPYFSAIRQYWEALDSIKDSLNGTEIDPESLSVLQVIGVSFTIEYGLIGIYEKTIGRIFEWLHFNTKTAEDFTTDSIARKYSESLLQTPWYEFPYASAITQLWQEWDWSSLSPRGLERRIIFTLGYHLKGAYAALLGKVTEANFGYVGSTTSVVVNSINPETLSAIQNITSVQATSSEIYALAPRYRAFTPAAQQIAEDGANFSAIQDNVEILISFVAPQPNVCLLPGQTVFILPILTHDNDARYGQLIKVSNLSQALRQLTQCGITIEHIYDY